MSKQNVFKRLFSAALALLLTAALATAGAAFAEAELEEELEVVDLQEQDASEMSEINLDVLDTLSEGPQENAFSYGYGRLQVDSGVYRTADMNEQTATVFTPAVFVVDGRYEGPGEDVLFVAFEMPGSGPFYAYVYAADVRPMDAGEIASYEAYALKNREVLRMGINGYDYILDLPDSAPPGATRAEETIDADSILEVGNSVQEQEEQPENVADEDVQAQARLVADPEALINQLIVPLVGDSKEETPPTPTEGALNLLVSPAEASYEQGSLATFDVTVWNSGPDALYDVTLSAENGGLFGSAAQVEVGTLAAEQAQGDAKTFTLTFPTEDANADEPSVTVDVTAQGYTSQTTQDSATAASQTGSGTVQVNLRRSVEILQEVDETEVMPDGQAIYTIDVYNNGSAPLSNLRVTALPADGEFSQPSDAGVTVNSADKTQVSIDLLPVGESVTLQYIFTVPTDAAKGETYERSVRVSDADNNELGLLPLQRISAADGITPFADEAKIDVSVAFLKWDGDKAIFSITLKNTGTASLRTNDISSVVTYGTSTVPAGTYTVGTSTASGSSLRLTGELAADKQVEFQYACTAPSGTPLDTIFDIKVTVNAHTTAYTSGQTAGTPDATGTDTASTTVRTDPTEPTDPDANLVVMLTAPKTTYAPGETITYTVKVSNDAAATLYNVALTADLPQGATFVTPSGTAAQGVTVSGNVLTISTLAAGESREFSMQYVIPTTTAGGTILVGQVSAKGNTLANGTGISVEGSSSVPVTITTTAVAPSLDVTKTVGKTMYARGDTATYVIMVKNTGTVNAYNITVNDTLTGGSFATLSGANAVGVTLLSATSLQIASLAPNESRTFNFTYQIPKTTEIGVDIMNTVNVTGYGSATGSGLSASDTASVSTRVYSPTDSPETGDNSQRGLLLGGMGFALMTAVYSGLKMRRREDEA